MISDTTYSPRERGGGSDELDEERSDVGEKTVLEVVSPTLEGILPFKKSRLVPFGNIRFVLLAGNRDSLSGCGVWMKRGCLEHDQHIQSGLDGVEVCGKDVVEFYKASCGRLACKVCYEKACAKHAVKMEHRMRQFRLKGRELKAIHVVVSPPKKDWGLSVVDMRRKAYRIAMRCGVIGGSIIFHHLRKLDEDDFREVFVREPGPYVGLSPWYESPHFHVIGYGWVRQVRANYMENGWIVKNLGVRKSIRATAHYQLSHCFVAPKFHSIVWFGALAYNKMRALPLPPEKHECPLCGSEFRKVEFVDSELASIVLSTLEKEEILFVDPGLFRYKGYIWVGGNGFG